MAQVKIEPKFAVTNLTKENLASEAQRCVPTLQQTTTSMENLRNRWPIPSNQSIALRHVSSASVYVITQNQGFCIRTSERRFAILAAEALFSTVNPQGIAPDVLTDWYQQIAKQLATTGLVKVAYVMNNGNAYVVRYWLSEQAPKYALNYSDEFKRTGAWESDSYDLRFNHKDMRGVVVTQYGDTKTKQIPVAHRY
jgi:hypothetical protein